MSQISNVIKQVRRLTGLFGNRVAGAAEFAAAKDQGWMTPPAAYVVPVSFDASPNVSTVDLYQIVTERIAVIVEFSNATGVNAGDRRGQTVAEMFETVQFGLFKALLSWNPMNIHENPDLYDPSDPTIGHGIKGFYLVGGEILSYDLSRLFYQWVFALETTITEKDGWEMTGDPLERIGLTITDANAGEIEGDILATALVNLAQGPMTGLSVQAQVGKLTPVSVDGP